HNTDGVSPTLSTMQGGNRQPKIAIPGNTVKTVGNVNPSGNGMNGDVFSGAGLSPTLTTNKGEGPKVCLPTLTPDRVNKRQNGRRFKEDGEPMFTLTAQDKHGVMLGGLYTNASKDFQRPPRKNLSRTIKSNKHDAAITDGFRIRKLTPLECFRLQGFTDEQFYKAKNEGVSNSQLYKQAGNSVSVPVIKAIAERL